MATQIANQFTSYDMSEEEIKLGSMYSHQHIQVLQNHLSAAAHLKLNLVYDPNNPVDFAQQVAYLQGKMDILSLLIDTSKSTELQMIEDIALNQAVEAYQSQQTTSQS